MLVIAYLGLRREVLLPGESADFIVRPFVVLHDLVCVTPSIPAVLGSCVDGNEGPS